MAILATETWKPMLGKATLYEVSDYGRVRSLSGYRGVNMWGAKCFLKGKILKPRKNKKGYLVVQVQNKSLVVHRLVALAFFPTENYENLQINHIDCDKTNNLIENLEWCDNVYNTAHAVENNLYAPITGINNSRSILNPENVLEIRNLLKTTNLTETQIANMFNVKRSAIANVKHGRTWKQVN